MASTTRAWDEGIKWHLEQSADQAPDFDLDSLTVPFIRDEHLKAANGSLEDGKIDRLRKTSLRMAQNATGRSLIPQGWSLVMDRFPCWEIVVPRPPLLSVDLIEYVDESGNVQQLTGSPAEFLVSAPSGPTAKYGRITPLPGGSWPSTQDRMDAVTVHFQAGYALVNTSPQVASIPDDLDDGRLLVIGELYKQRSESVHAFNQNPAVIRARALWSLYKVY